MEPDVSVFMKIYPERILAILVERAVSSATVSKIESQGVRLA
jgi:hypothetical protein